MLLDMRRVCKRIGAAVIIHDLDLAIPRGQLVGVIGPNGAGKSTAFGLIAGNLSCTSGSVRLEGRDITGLGADARCRAGIGRTFQIPQPFAGLTAYENALVAATYGAGLSGNDARRAARDALTRCGLVPLADVMSGGMTLLQRKRLELARALATDPCLLLLDEVGGGLTDGEARQLVELVGEIHARGVTIVWIEHLVHALASAVERLVVLSEGRIIADGVPADVVQQPLVRQTYLGEDLATEDGALHA